MANPSPTASRYRSTLLAGTVGNVMEWYDFAIYGSLAPVLGKQFFPSNDPLSSTLATFGVFAAGYAARPAGGAILGHIGDRFGRKPALTISVLAMGAATCAIGLLPTHASAGALAAVLLVILRIVQGLSVGGEFTGSITYLVEHAQARRRGLVAALPQFGCIGGFLLGAVVSAVVAGQLSETALNTWGWRIPFLSGSLIAALGLIFRRKMSESPMLSHESRLHAPIVAAVRDHWRRILNVVFLIMPGSIGFYLVFVYITSYLTEHMHQSTAAALDINSWGLLLMFLLTLPGACLSDRFGRKPLLYLVTFGMLLFSWPLWWLIHQPQLGYILFGQLGFAAMFGLGFAVFPVTMAEMFPSNVRCIATSIAYNATVAVLGGTTPLVATYLVDRTGDDFAPVWYLMAFAALSLLAVLRLSETSRIDLE